MKTKTSVISKKEIAFNNHIFVKLFFVCFGFLLVSFGLWSDEIIFTLCGIFIVLGLIMSLLVSSTHYVFTDEYVVICHPFKRKEIIQWADVRRIRLYNSRFYRLGRGFNFYKIYYHHKKEEIFLNGEICRSRKTKRLLEKYYKGNV